MSEAPAGEEREVKFLGGAALDGAPIAYIVVLAAVVLALSFIPFSVVLATGGSFPLSQSASADQPRAEIPAVCAAVLRILARRLVQL